MSWDIRDAIALVDQLLITLGRESHKADESVSQAKILWQQDQQRNALGLFVD